MLVCLICSAKISFESNVRPSTIGGLFWLNFFIIGLSFEWSAVVVECFSF